MVAHPFHLKKTVQQSCTVYLKFVMEFSEFYTLKRK